MDPTAPDLSPLRRQARQLRAEIDGVRGQIAGDTTDVDELDRLDARCRTFADAADVFADSLAGDGPWLLLLRKVARLARDQAHHYRQLRRTVEEIGQVPAGRRQRSLYDELKRRSGPLLNERHFEAALSEFIEEAS